MTGQEGMVNVSVANIYRNASYQSEVVTQALLTEKIVVSKSDNNFSLVKLQDGYEGWISNYQWVAADKRAVEYKKVRSHFIKIYDSPDDNHRCLRDATIGTNLSVLDNQNGWSQIILPDGIKGWVESHHFGPFPTVTREGVIQLANEFIGYPYHWGGRSVKGFDCSGLIQTIFALVGINLPRDAWMQHRDVREVGHQLQDVQPGDLYFFAEGGTKITHVGLAVGEGRIIHARGMVCQNSLLQSQPDYSEELNKSFVGIKSFF